MTKVKKLFVLAILVAILAIAFTACTSSSPNAGGSISPASGTHDKAVEELPKLTLADATKVLDLSSELPPGFAGSYSSKLEESSLLGTGSGSQFYIRGTPLATNPWYQIQLITWVVDNEVAQNTSVEEVLAEYHLTGDHIDVGNKADAIKNGDYGSGLEFLVIKYQNAYVVMNSWYSHPQDEYVDMIQPAKVIVERLSGYSY